MMMKKLYWKGLVRYSYNLVPNIQSRVARSQSSANQEEAGHSW